MYDFSEITTDKLKLSSHVKVLKAQEYNRYLNAQALVNAAEQKAADIINKAEVTFEQHKLKGYQEGLVKAQQQQSQMMLDTLEKCRQYYKKSETHLSQIVIKAIRKLIGNFDDIELTLKMTRQAMHTVSNQRQVTLHVAPSQVEEIKARLGQVMKEFPEISYVEVTADGRVEPGGCLLETEVGVIDATLENQLAVIEETVNKKPENQPEEKSQTMNVLKDSFKATTATQSQEAELTPV